MMDQNYAADKESAFILVTEGRATVNGQKAISPAQMVTTDARIVVRGIENRYVGRGALKLLGALDEWRIDLSGLVSADIGAATGGFTEILLRRGVRRVYAIDTAYGKLDLKLREDRRVVVMEKTDVRNLQNLPEQVDLAVMDVSLISLRDTLPLATRFLKPEGLVIALFKPQYETRDPRLLKNGVIISQVARETLLNEFLMWADGAGWQTIQHMKSPIRGSTGNVEYLLLLQNAKIKMKN